MDEKLKEIADYIAERLPIGTEDAEKLVEAIEWNQPFAINSRKSIEEYERAIEARNKRILKIREESVWARTSLLQIKQIVEASKGLY